MLRLAALALLVPTAALTLVAQDKPAATRPPARIEVKDAQGKAIASAGLYYAYEAEVTEWERQQRGIEALDWYSKVALLGHTARTDVNGLFDLPPFEGSVLVIAHRDNHFFARAFKSTAPPFECPLTLTTPLRVRLVDPSGAPIQGEVALRASDGLESFDLTSAPLSPLDGLVHLFGADGFQDEVDAGYRMSVVQVGVFRNIPTEVVDLSEVIEGPVQLKGLPTGAIDLTLKDTDGKPLRGEIEVHIEAVLKPEERQVPPPPLMRITDDGHVLLPYVGLGVELRVVVQRPHSSNSKTYEVKGPTAAGQVVPQRIDYKELDVLLMGRLFDDKGEPLVDDYVDVQFKTGNFLTRGEGVITVRTRADGSFQFPLICRGRDAIQNAQVKFVRQVEQIDLHLEYDWSVASVTNAGVLDLGDLRMKRP